MPLEIIEAKYKKELNTTADPILRSKLLNDIAWEINRSYPNKAIEFASEALQLSEENKNTIGIASAKKNIGSAYIWLSDNENASQLLFESQILFRELSEKVQEAEVVYNIATNFYYLADYDNALKYFMQSYSLYGSIANKIGMADSLNGIGSVYNTIGENEKAIESLQKALSYSVEAGDKVIRPKILDGLGTALNDAGKYEEALIFIFDCLDILQKTNGSKQTQAFALNEIGRTYLLKKEYDKALNFFEQGLKIINEINFKNGVAELLTNIGRAHFLQGNIDTALEFANQSLLIANEVKARDVIFRCFEFLSEIYEEKKDFETAFKYHKLFTNAKEELKSEKARQKSKSLDVQFKMEQAEGEKELLKLKNEELEKYSKDVTLLSEMGVKITGCLSVESIIDTVYEQVNTLMDAPCLGIGIVDKENNVLTFPGYVEKGIKLPTTYSLDDFNRLAIWCIRNKKDILMGDFMNDATKYIDVIVAPVSGESTESIIYCPLLVKGKLIGVITVQSFQKNIYTSYHLNIIKNLAVYTAIAIDNASLYEGLEEKVRERTVEISEQKEAVERSHKTTQLLSEIGQQLTSTLDFNTLFEKLHENVSKLMTADCFGVRLYYPDKNVVNYEFEIESGEIVPPETVSIDDKNNLSVWCIKNKKEIFINDIEKEYTQYANEIALVGGEMPLSLIFYPLTIADRVIGAITVQSFSKNAYLPFHLDILRTLASYTAIALDNASLYERMEDKVKERTNEVVLQKEQIEKTFSDTKLISEIGKEISATLSVEEIISKVYNSINTLMDATIFGIALLREKQKDLFFSGVMEKGIRLSDFSYKLSEEKIATICFNKNQEIVINDWDLEYKQYVAKDYEATQADLPESMIYLPLVSKGRNVGVISVQCFEKNAYNEYHLNILRSLSIYVGSAIENASLYRGMEERVNERTAEIEKAYQNTKLLSQISKDISSSLSIETIVEKVYENVNDLMDAASFGIGIYNPISEQIAFPGFIELGIRIDNATFNANDDRLAGWCFRNKKEIFTNCYSQEYVKYVKSRKAVVVGKQSESIIYLPLSSKEKVIGVITIQSYKPNAYTEYHLDIIRNLSHSIAIALENATLYGNLEEKVKERTGEVVRQKEIIEEKNKHITDSILYAKRIQQAILPSDNFIKESLPDSFVIYKPKDIVSGDFYWVEKKENKILFAVVDCTGHGVPGAFMSIVGYNGLNQAVNEYGMSTPSDILNRLNQSVSETLHQKNTESAIRDGMDIALCSIDFKNKKLEFAGAFNPVYLIRGKELIEIKADKQPIGAFVGEIYCSFTNHVIDLKKGDQIYISSDGYADQFGGDNGKKFMRKNFKDLLLKNKSKSIEQQGEILDETFEAWRGKLEQVDDICVIGIKIK